MNRKLSALFIAFVLCVTFAAPALAQASFHYEIMVGETKNFEYNLMKGAISITAVSSDPSALSVTMTGLLSFSVTGLRETQKGERYPTVTVTLTFSDVMAYGQPPVTQSRTWIDQFDVNRDPDTAPISTPTPAPTSSSAPVPPAAGGDYYVLGTNQLSYTAGEEIVVEYAGFGVNGAEVPGALLTLYRHDSSGITPIMGAGLSGIRTTTSDGAYYTWSFGTKDLKQGNYTVCICTNSKDPVGTAVISYDVYIATSVLPSATPVPNAPNQPATNHTGTPDGTSSWAYDEVSKAISLGFIPSELQKNYQTNITRQEFCEMIIQMLKAKSGGLENEASFLNHFGVVIGESAFSDTTNRNVNIAYELQIVNGTGNRKFAPDGFITRQEAAAMLTNAARVFEFTTFEGTPIQFVDMDTVAVWARGGVNFVSATGIMNGTGSNQFVPMEKYTREQAITTMLRLYNAFPRDYYTL